VPVDPAPTAPVDPSPVAPAPAEPSPVAPGDPAPVAPGEPTTPATPDPAPAPPADEATATRLFDQDGNVVDDATAREMLRALERDARTEMDGFRRDRRNGRRWRRGD